MYLPAFLANHSWPESVKKDFSGQLHKFMASLTETAHHSKGHTVLYVPDEKVDHVQEAATDKDLVQRLESTLIHWTRQIKEVCAPHLALEFFHWLIRAFLSLVCSVTMLALQVVSNQETSHHVDSAGPLDEIAFWRSRTVDLSGIKEQLDRADVRQIVEVLEAASSSYLKPFKVPRDMIEQGLKEL